MCADKIKLEFGLDKKQIAAIDWQLAVDRIAYDSRSDFIYAPHLSFIYRRASDKLIEEVKSQLSGGNFSCGVPLTIEVPKSYKMKVASSPRLGPNYSRPGSILLPHDRLLYQALADRATSLVREKTDASRSFSHELADEKSAQMFIPTRTCWNNLQKSLQNNSKSDNAKYVVKIDIANFFGSINQHLLVNFLVDSGYAPELGKRLEEIFLSYAGSRSSRGILQGMATSDLLGNFYLTPIDEFLEEYGVPSARYVDDIYLFVGSVKTVDKLFKELIPQMREYGLSLNESKSKIMPVASLVAEEPDLEALFEAAIEEISSQIDDEDFDVDYGFQGEWDDDEDEKEGDGEDVDESDEDDHETSLLLKATKHLFDSISDYPGQEENIERFCIPLFIKANSDYAIDHVKDSFKKRPSMTQIYASYLSKFFAQEEVYTFLVECLEDEELGDWQKIWILAALMRKKDTPIEPVKAALKIFKNAAHHDCLKAVAAVYVGSFGDHTRRTALRTAYPNVSPYVQAAIYYSSRQWPTPEKLTARSSWSAHSALHKLITQAVSSTSNAPKAEVG